MSPIRDEDLSRGLVCDVCGKPLLVDEDVRYVVDIRVYAAADPMELTQADLDKDHLAEMRRILDAIKHRDAQELEDEIHQEFTFHLCPMCRKVYVKDPIGRSGAANST